jgi:hypothetical protein
MSKMPFNGNNLPRIVIAGVALAVFGVIAFILIWGLMGSAGVANLPRLLVSMCIPPALIAAILGVYILVSRSKSE